jgi:hypothetical protein
MRRTETEIVYYTNTGSTQSHTKPIFYITGSGDGSTDVMEWNRERSVAYDYYQLHFDDNHNDVMKQRRY